jgi:hypothetical protein
MTQPQSSKFRIDPRGAWFSAWVNTVVLIAVLVTGSAVLLAAQAVVFAIGAFASPQQHPYGRALPRLRRHPAWSAH